MNDNDILLKKLFNKHVVSSIISMFGAMASVMANSIIAGKFFGAEGLAVMSIVAPFYSLFSTCGALSAVGGSTLTSHALGRDDNKKADEIFTLSLFSCVGIYIIVAAICFIFLEQLLYLLGCSQNIFMAAYDYAEIYIILGFGTTIIYMPANFFKLIGKLKHLTEMFIGMAIFNIILDIVFVKVFDMNIAGIALGTVISSICATAFGMKHLITGENSFKIVRITDYNSIKKIFKLGTPSALNNLLNFFRLIIMNRIIAAIAGDIGLAAFSVFSALEKFSLVVLTGLSQATSAFVGVFTKEADTVSVRRIEKRAHIIGLILIAVMTFAIMIFPENICNLFGIYDGKKLFIASQAAYIFAFSLPPSVFCFLMFSYYQSVGFTNLANILIFSRNFLFMVLPAYLLTPIFGLNAVWYSMTIASISPLIIMLIAMPIYFKKGYSGIFLQDLKAERNGNYISFAVQTNLESIIDSVEKIADFCKKNNLNRKDIMLVKLSMEEMMISIAEHCFDNKPDENMDVRILIVTNSDDIMIILRIRTGGKLFNPIDYYERLSETDPLALGDALGISMIIKAADAIHYKTTFGINNLTVIIDRTISKD